MGGLGHNFILQDRAKLSLSGIEDVESFYEDRIICRTTCGKLNISGENLHVDKLSLEIGELSVDGRIDSLVYETEQKDNGGFWARLFK